MRSTGCRITITLLWVLIALPASAAGAGRAADISAASNLALKRLCAAQPSARMLGDKAKAVLVFPKILKAGFMFGAQGGEGALRRAGKTVGYYRTLAASYGFQAGMQSFGYALFFLTDASMQQLEATHGFELGSGPSLVVVDEGMAKSITTSTLTGDVYAFVFDQKGLMAGLGIQGSKITRIHPH